MTTQNSKTPKYPGIPVTTNGNILVSYYTEARLADAGIFYPITPSTEMGENFELSFAKGEPNVFGRAKMAIETEGEHAAQGGAIAFGVTGKRVVNFTSAQGIAYGLEQYYHAPGKLSSMVLEVGARALTKTSLNVHCSHDDVYATLDTGWIALFAKNAQQAADQSLILRRVTEKALNPGLNAQDGFLTTHLDRTFLYTEAELIREFLGAPDDIIDTPTAAQRELFGPKRRRVPEAYDLKNPVLIGTVQNQEHYMNGVAAHRNHFCEQILGFLEESYTTFGELTGRNYGLISQYNCEKAETVFLCMGSAAENIEAAIDYIRQKDGVEVGVIHLNVIRPFPEKAIIEALRGKKNVIILERTDEQIAGDNPMARDVRTALSKALENSKEKSWQNLPSLTLAEMPRLFAGVYGLGSRDFRPEHILGAYEYAAKGTKRQDGKTAQDGEHFFYLGIDHPYSVISKDCPSLLPDKAIAVRFHSIGGWGAITTGKNLSELLGEMGRFIQTRDKLDKEVLHISANPKYGSEKKGAPTNYFLVAAPEKIRVNCDLQHVDAVLCCDPKAFTHTNPVAGIKEGGAFIWESNETDAAKAWQRIPKKYRQQIIDKKIRLFALPGFKIAEESTNKPELQLRMQGNSFLGAFFKVSTFLKDNGIGEEDFLKAVKHQYEYKFGKLGAAVIESNMKVMQAGFSRLTEIKHGSVEDPDSSAFTGTCIMPKNVEKTVEQKKSNYFSKAYFESEFRAGLGYHQPASPLAAAGILAASTGEQSSKFVARRKIPKWHAEKCIQCMECVMCCPDNALPNTAQDINVILTKAVNHYVTNDADRKALLEVVKEAEASIRATMVDESAKKAAAEPFAAIAMKAINAVAQTHGTLSKSNTQKASLDELSAILTRIPVAYAQTNQVFAMKEKKEAGTGGVFGIFVGDLCKGCGQCAYQCGHREAITMEDETEEMNGNVHTWSQFMNLLPDTPQKYLGLYDAENPRESKNAALRYHLMQRSNYSAMVCGDGSCMGCGEKPVLRMVSSLTEAYMRPLYRAKAERLRTKAAELKVKGVQELNNLQKSDPEAYEQYRILVAHLIYGLGGENDKDTALRMAGFKATNQEMIDKLVAHLEQDAFNHQDLQAIEGKAANGMSVMGMAASTGCNSVYGSTPPANPHTYPWMNSLFQDSPTIGWLFAESFNQNHCRNTVVPERVATLVLEGFTTKPDKQLYWDLVHFTDKQMTELEVQEMPRVWSIGGDGAIGDIGFQNLSKATLQNRPNYACLMLDTQVYSNTGGQNSDSSVMPGGFDMNQFGAGSQGKLTEKKEVAQILTVGHGSPFIAQVSVANHANLYRAILEAVAYRGAGFIQAFTACMPEHGIGDNMATEQAQRARDSRGVVEFLFDPTKGESDAACLDVAANPQSTKDWAVKTSANKEKYTYTVAHWGATESRFRNHMKKAAAEVKTTAMYLEDVLWRTTQQDVINRRVFDKDQICYVPDFGVYFYAEQADGSLAPMLMSRQLVLWCVERRKNWRHLQGRAGIVNEDLAIQNLLLDKYAKGEYSKEDMMNNVSKLVEQLRAQKQPVTA